MDIFKSYATDKTLEENGVKIIVAKDDKSGKESWIRVARLGNQKFNQCFDRLQKQNRVNGMKKLSPEVTEKLLIEAIAETILVDWSGLSYKGEEIAYSKENAIKMLTEAKDWLDEIVTLAKNMETFRIQDMEDSAKNLPKSSVGI